MSKVCPFCGDPVTSSHARNCGKDECRKKQNKMSSREIIVVPDGYITTSEYAVRHNLSVQTISKRCRAGSVYGAWQDKFSGRWYLPDDGVVCAGDAPDKSPRRVVRHRLKATANEYFVVCERARDAGMSVNEYLLMRALQ